MANAKQLKILNSGVEVWNKWRQENQHEKIDLSKASIYVANLHEANLAGAYLSGAHFVTKNLSGANLAGVIFPSANLAHTDLSGANLAGAGLMDADLNGSNLTNANLNNAKLLYAELRLATLINADLTDVLAIQTNFGQADLTGADLRRANLSAAYFGNANLNEANLSDAILTNANLVGTKIGNANISNCKIYGVNVWDLVGEFKEQKELIITPDDTSVITVDNIKVAQFVYLILNNKEIRDVLNTLTSKTVLILGRFALQERKLILDALRNKLREYDLLPIVFDFDRPTDKDFTETIKTLAGMCYFVIADVTNPKSSPLELQATVPDYQIPFVPIIQEGESPFAMMVDLQKKYDWVLDTISYKDGDQLIRVLKKGIIDRAMKKHDELRLIKAQIPTVISASQFEE